MTLLTYHAEDGEPRYFDDRLCTSDNDYEFDTATAKTLLAAFPMFFSKRKPPASDKPAGTDKK